jgi:rod shape-determining protein MreC
MFRLLFRYRELLIVGVLLGFPLVSYLSSGHRGRAPNLVDRAILALASPVQAAFTWMVDGLGGTVSGYVALRGAHQEAQACRVELAESHAALNALKEAEAENRRLKAALGYAEPTVEQEIVARVIGLNPSPQFQSIRISRGEDDGVRAGMPVLTPDGVVGQVVRAVGGSADVMLLTDPASRIGSVLQRTRVRATVVGLGDGRRLALNLVRREDDAKDGDEVVTSGTDGIFPEGLHVGTVYEVQRPAVGMFLSALVKPSVDLQRVEEVLVIPVTLSSAPAAVFQGGGR